LKNFLGGNIPQYITILGAGYGAPRQILPPTGAPGLAPQYVNPALFVFV